MGEVVSMAEEKLKRSPHVTGGATCIMCGHKEVAIAPAGVVWMECSICHTMKLVFDLHVGVPGGRTLTCGCDNQLFFILDGVAFCPNCGDRRTISGPTFPIGA